MLLQQTFCRAKALSTAIRQIDACTLIIEPPIDVKALHIDNISAERMNHGHMMSFWLIHDCVVHQLFSCSTIMAISSSQKAEALIVTINLDFRSNIFATEWVEVHTFTSCTFTVYKCP